MSENVIAETLAKHQPNTTEGGGPYIAVQCACDRTFRAWQFHAAHQAEMVREALTSDEAVKRFERTAWRWSDDDWHDPEYAEEREFQRALAIASVAKLIGEDESNE